MQPVCWEESHELHIVRWCTFSDLLLKPRNNYSLSTNIIFVRNKNTYSIRNNLGKQTPCLCLTPKSVDTYRKIDMSDQMCNRDYCCFQLLSGQLLVTQTPYSSVATVLCDVIFSGRLCKLCVNQASTWAMSKWLHSTGFRLGDIGFLITMTSQWAR